MWPLLYGTAVILIAWRAFRSAGVELRVAALAIFVDWSASNIARWLAPFDYRPTFMSTDWAMATILALAWVSRRHAWMAVLGMMYAISGTIGMFAYSADKMYSYDLALNAAFVARLAVIWIVSSEPRRGREQT